MSRLSSVVFTAVWGESIDNVDSMKRLMGQIGSVFLTLTRFHNPLIILMTRLGVLKIPYFIFRFNTAKKPTAMLGRPTTTSLADLFVIKEVFIHETYKDILPLLAEGGVRFVDIGANLGSFSIWLAQQRNVVSSYCFEPEPDSFRLLCFNLSLNGCEGVIPIHAAVGGTQREISIQLKSSSPGGTSIYSDGRSDTAQHSDRTRIKVVAFSEWLHEAAYPLDLLKLDCEGAEWEIVRACGHIIGERFKVVVAEVHDDPDKESAVDAFPKLMEKHGFSTLRWDGKSQGLYVGKRVS
jgi:FkbM family methyltransferase